MRVRPRGGPDARGIFGARARGDPVDLDAVGVAAGAAAHRVRVVRGGCGAAAVRGARRATRLVEQHHPPLPVLKPVRIELPTLGMRAPVMPVAVSDDGALRVPADPQVVGWWAGAGDTVVLDGHVDTAAQGPGVLFRLVDLPRGMTSRSSAPTARCGGSGSPTCGPTRRRCCRPRCSTPSRLVIITCGGHFDWHTRQYAENIVAFAERVS